MKILIAEDQKPIIELLTICLEGQGHEIHSSESGDDALVSLISDNFDLLILDNLLPIIPGEVILKRLNILNKDIPTIIISGCAVQELYEKYGKYKNVCKIFQKPMPLKEVTKAVLQAQDLQIKSK